MTEKLYYSCDSHVVEGPEVFEGLVDKFGERAPRVVQDPPGREGLYLVWPKQDLPLPIGRFGIAGANLDLPETKERIKQGWDGINPGVKDPVARLKEQAQDGIVGEVMYPSINMFTFSVPDREVVQEVFRRHNDWIVDYCSHSPDRLIGVGCLPLPDVEESITELERVVKRGLRGVAIPCTAPADKPYSDPLYEPFWSAAEDAGMPITMHIFCGSEWGMSLPSHWNAVTSYAMALSAISWTVETLITSGVVERHPQAAVRLRRVGDRLDGALVGAPRPRRLPLPLRHRKRGQGQAHRVLPSQLPRHLRGRRVRHSHPRRHRRRPHVVGQRLPPPRTRSGPTPARSWSGSCATCPRRKSAR